MFYVGNDPLKYVLNQNVQYRLLWPPWEVSTYLLMEVLSLTCTHQQGKLLSCIIEDLSTYTYILYSLFI